MNLRKVLLVAVITSAVCWTSVEASFADGLTNFWCPAKEEPPPCETPLDGNWEVSSSIDGGDYYYFDMSAVAEGIFNGSGYVRNPAIQPPPEPIPLTLVAQFNETACVFAGTFIIEQEDMINSFLWSVIDRGHMTGYGLLAVGGILESPVPLEQTANVIIL